jgi:type IV pilus assembly protein PilB
MSETQTAPASTAQTAALAVLGRVLVASGKLDNATAQKAMKGALANRKSLIAELVDSGAMSPLSIAQVLSQAFSAPLLDVAALNLSALPDKLLDERICKEYQLLVLGKRNHALVIATADPSNQEAAEKIKFATQRSVDWVVVEYNKLIPALKTEEAVADNTVIANFADSDFEEQEFIEETDTPTPAENEIDDSPVVRFLQKMLYDAVTMGASDLHFEPYETTYRVRFRIDGELREIASPPPAIKEKLASRIKVISRMDISEKRVPQDGRMKLKMSREKTIDFRVSTLPTLFGEKIVIRILDPSSAKLGIDALGYEETEKQRLLRAIARPYGMILVTGPTGSGKTVSLYTCLNLLNQPGVNIATAEDPSEINMPGVNQVNVNDKAGLTFAAALKSFLRQDPDIIMVGEIRDLETADIAMKAAQTGHLVLSTLHTNDAPTTLTRMRNMGVQPFNIAASVILITAQRLARRLCVKCKEPFELPREILLESGFREADIDGSWRPYRPVGCSACNNGYKGRVGIYQVMPISDEIQTIILRDGSAMEIAAQSEREGVKSLRMSGLSKVKLGLTSLEEVLAVTNE